MHDCATGPFCFCYNSNIQTFTWTCYSYILFHKLLAWNKKKVKFYLNNIVLHPTSVMRYQIPVTSHSLIGVRKKLNHFHGPYKVQTSYHHILSVGMYKHPCLHIENNRFKSSARENTSVTVVTIELLSEHRKKLSTV